MTTRIAAVGFDTYQVSTYLEEMDFTINQYLVVGDEPMLFHTGMRGLFSDVRAAVSEVLDPSSLRWISFGHVEADECGAMNDWLECAPAATVAFGELGCMLSIADMATRAPVPLVDGDVFADRFRWIATPHVPHGWEAGLVFDQATRTLFCGDLLSVYGNYEPTTSDDYVASAIDAENAMPSMSLHPQTGAIIRTLADLSPAALAPMHGPVFTGDCASALRALADDAQERLARLVA